jgi:NAD(P)-dependent dehydrogenase (short-subunit alcohol dehydrogenase family)
MYEKITRTEEGFEAQFGANHLGHFLFTSLIFPALRSAATPEVPSRVVTVSSLVVAYDAQIRWDDPSFELRPEEYHKYTGYKQSKLANAMFARELTKRYKSENIIGFSLNPGGTWICNEWKRTAKACLLPLPRSHLRHDHG